MGIKDLVSFLKKNYPELFKTSFKTWQQEKNCNCDLRIAIDVPILAYKLAYASGTDFLVPRILAYASSFTKNTGVPVFVFDGNSLPEKSEEKAKRSAAYQKRPSPPVKETRKLFQDESDICVELGPAPCTQPNKKDYENIKEALLSHGYECRTAKFEAEALCSFLCSTGNVHAVLTEDSDAFAYCAPCVILKYGSSESVVLQSDKIFEALQISRDCFVDFCVLLGNDFNERIHLVGPVKALALLKKHATLRQVLTSESVSDEKMERMLKSGEIFRSFCYENVESA